MDKASMFEQARSLIAGAKIIMDHDGIIDNDLIRKPTTPVILCCAFAIEVCLKLLLLDEGSQVANNHNLEELFKKLSPEKRDLLVEIYLSQNQDVTREELIKNINDHKNVFVTWRYAYEKEVVFCSPSFLYSLAYCLISFIENNYEFERNDNGWLKAV